MVGLISLALLCKTDSGGRLHILCRLSCDTHKLDTFFEHGYKNMIGGWKRYQVYNVAFLFSTEFINSLSKSSHLENLVELRRSVNSLHYPFEVVSTIEDKSLFFLRNLCISFKMIFYCVKLKASSLNSRVFGNQWPFFFDI